jgi:hypothetical protein
MLAPAAGRPAAPRERSTEAIGMASPPSGVRQRLAGQGKERFSILARKPHGRSNRPRTLEQRASAILVILARQAPLERAGPASRDFRPTTCPVLRGPAAVSGGRVHGVLGKAGPSGGRGSSGGPRGRSMANSSAKPRMWWSSVAGLTTGSGRWSSCTRPARTGGEVEAAAARAALVGTARSPMYGQYRYYYN